MCWLVFYLLYTSTWIIIFLQLTSFCSLRTSSPISSMTVMFLIVKINKDVGAEKNDLLFHLKCPVVFKNVQIVFGPRLGSLRRSSKPPSRLGRGIPPPHFIPPRRLRRLVLGAFGASSSEPPTPAPHCHFNHWSHVYVCHLSNGSFDHHAMCDWHWVGWFFVVRNELIVCHSSYARRLPFSDRQRSLAPRRLYPPNLQ